MIVPDPQYDRDVSLLVRAYKAALLAIAHSLAKLGLAGMARANAKIALVEVSKILRGLNEESAAWVERNIPKAATDGVVRSLVDLGVAPTVEAAEKIAKFNRINREFVASAIADTQADLLAVTQNVDRRVKQAVRQATAETMRANLTQGINGRRTLNRDNLDRMRQALGSAVDTGIIDSAGRRWKPEVYVDMVTRTKMQRTHMDATINEAVGRGAYYGRISRHGAVDACRFWEGRIVKLTPDAPGDYPYIGNLPRREIFHPNCRHVISPVREPERKPLAENPLPNFDKAVIPDAKLVGYALNPDHSTGKHKALVFDKVLGYNLSNWEELQSKVRDTLGRYDAKNKGDTPYGTKFEVVMPITGPSGRTAEVTTAWQIAKGEEVPKLTTLLIKEAGKSK